MRYNSSAPLPVLEPAMFNDEERPVFGRPESPLAGQSEEAPHAIDEEEDEDFLRQNSVGSTVKCPRHCFDCDFCCCIYAVLFLIFLTGFPLYLKFLKTSPMPRNHWHGADFPVLQNWTYVQQNTGIINNYRIDMSPIPTTWTGCNYSCGDQGDMNFQVDVTLEAPGFKHAAYPVLLASMDFQTWWVAADRRDAEPQGFFASSEPKWAVTHRLVTDQCSRVPELTHEDYYDHFSSSPSYLLVCVTWDWDTIQELRALPHRKKLTHEEAAAKCHVVGGTCGWACSAGSQMPLDHCSKDGQLRVDELFPTKQGKVSLRPCVNPSGDKGCITADLPMSRWPCHKCANFSTPQNDTQQKLKAIKTKVLQDIAAKINSQANITTELKVLGAVTSDLEEASAQLHHIYDSLPQLEVLLQNFDPGSLGGVKATAPHAFVFSSPSARGPWKNVYYGPDKFPLPMPVAIPEKERIKLQDIKNARYDLDRDKMHLVERNRLSLKPDGCFSQRGPLYLVACAVNGSMYEDRDTMFELSKSGKVGPPPFNDRCIVASGRCAHACMEQQYPLEHCDADGRIDPTKITGKIESRVNIDRLLWWMIFVLMYGFAQKVLSTLPGLLRPYRHETTYRKELTEKLKYIAVCTPSGGENKAVVARNLVGAISSQPPDCQCIFHVVYTDEGHRHSHKVMFHVLSNIVHLVEQIGELSSFMKTWVDVTRMYSLEDCNKFDKLNMNDRKLKDFSGETAFEDMKGRKDLLSLDQGKLQELKQEIEVMKEVLIAGTYKDKHGKTHERVLRILVDPDIDTELPEGRDHDFSVTVDGTPTDDVQHRCSLKNIRGIRQLKEDLKEYMNLEYDIESVMYQDAGFQDDWHKTTDITHIPIKGRIKISCSEHVQPSRNWESHLLAQARVAEVLQRELGQDDVQSYPPADCHLCKLHLHYNARAKPTLDEHVMPTRHVARGIYYYEVPENATNAKWLDLRKQNEKCKRNGPIPDGWTPLRTSSGKPGGMNFSENYLYHYHEQECFFNVAEIQSKNAIIDQAIAALNQGRWLIFWQNPNNVAVMEHLAYTLEMERAERCMLVDFLSDRSAASILQHIGIFKRMKASLKIAEAHLSMQQLRLTGKKKPALFSIADARHQFQPDCFEVTVPYFFKKGTNDVNPSVGFTQWPQFFPQVSDPYDYLDTNNANFFRLSCMIRNCCGGVSSCGTNGTWLIEPRTTAWIWSKESGRLEEHQTFNESCKIEDTASSIEVVLHGKHSHYIPMRLSVGMPKDARDYLAAQQRWAEGAVVLSLQTFFSGGCCKDGRIVLWIALMLFAGFFASIGWLSYQQKPSFIFGFWLEGFFTQKGETAAQVTVDTLTDLWILDHISPFEFGKYQEIVFGFVNWVMVCILFFLFLGFLTVMSWCRHKLCCARRRATWTFPTNVSQWARLLITVENLTYFLGFPTAFFWVFFNYYSVFVVKGFAFDPVIMAGCAFILNLVMWLMIIVSCFRFSSQQSGDFNQIWSLTLTNVWRTTQLYYITAPLQAYSLIMGILDFISHKRYNKDISFWEGGDRGDAARNIVQFWSTSLVLGVPIIWICIARGVAADFSTAAPAAIVVTFIGFDALHPCAFLWLRTRDPEKLSPNLICGPAFYSQCVYAVKLCFWKIMTPAWYRNVLRAFIFSPSLMFLCEWSGPFQNVFLTFMSFRYPNLGMTAALNVLVAMK